MVWESLDRAGMMLFDGTTSAAVGVVRHKFGSGAGDAAQDAVCVGKNVVQTVSNVRSLGAKAVAKTVVKASV